MAKLIDSKNELIFHNGSISSGSNYHEGSVIILSEKNTQEITFNFSGTSLSIYSQKNVYRSAGIAVDIDGEIHRMDQSGASDSGPWKIKVFSITDLPDKIHKVKIYMDDQTSPRKYDSAYSTELDYIEIDDNADLFPSLSKEYEFPIKTIEKADVEPYALSCIAEEEQLLIAIEDGSLYLTRGDGTYLQVGVTIEKFNELEQRVLALESK